MEIERSLYVDRLIKRKNNGLVKVITGVRRCGKSYLLFNLYHRYLLSLGINENHIMRIALDEEEHEDLLESKALGAYVRERVVDNDAYYVFLDEIQEVKGFEKVLNGLNRIQNLDVYVTGSNSKFLSSDILTEFRGRGDEIKVYPLRFAEFQSVYDGSVGQAWKDYYTFGGMPLILSRADDEMKVEYLTALFDKVYLSDICERNDIRHEGDLDALVDILASSTGSLTNPSKLERAFKSSRHSAITSKTIKAYIDYLMDAFLIERAQRYDVKGKRYLDTPAKYYFVDVGLRNARLGFRQQEENHIMENVIYNELRCRGYVVDVGVVDTTETNAQGKRQQKRLEIDFIARKGNEQCYIQSAFIMGDMTKEQQEKRSLMKIPDSFKKIVVVQDDIKAKCDNSGILTLGLFDFLLDSNSLSR
jgi:predicted AAA+ superfamily ATPase